MKNFVLLYSVSLLTVLHVSRGGTIEGVRKLAGIIKGSCIANTGVRTELIDDAIEGNFAEDPKLKCFAKCILAMLQSIRGNKFSSEGLKLIVKAILPDDLKERGYAAIEKCKDTWDESEDLCSASFSVVKCFYRTDIEAITRFEGYQNQLNKMWGNLIAILTTVTRVLLIVAVSPSTLLSIF